MAKKGAPVGNKNAKGTHLGVGRNIAKSAAIGLAAGAVVYAALPNANLRQMTMDNLNKSLKI